LGDHAGAEADLRDAIARAERLGLRQLIAAAEHNLGPALALRGRVDEAEEVERKALRHFADAGQRLLVANSHLYLATILLMRGDPAGAEREARAAIANARDNRQATASAEGTLGEILLAQGRTEEALAASKSAAAVADELGGLAERDILVRLVHAEALRATGCESAARAALGAARDRLLAVAARIDDAALRRCFLENVPENARTLELAAQVLEPVPSAPE
jgi:tetratricopeptide (TPR) repeat protein